MKAIKVVTGLMTVLVSMPIWFFLLYRVLESVNASELMWFLYWVYLPVTLLANIFASVILRIADKG